MYIVHKEENYTKKKTAQNTVLQDNSKGKRILPSTNGSGQLNAQIQKKLLS
jgi:hypothetical protein